MLYSRSALFKRLYQAIQAMPVIDCHEHMHGPPVQPPYHEPIAAMIHGYMFADMQSAAFGISDRDLTRLQDQSVSTDAKWPLFQRLWKATEHTAYARVTKLVLKQVYGEKELTREALNRVAAKLTASQGSSFLETIDRAGIEVVLADVLTGNMKGFLNGSVRFPEKWRPMISLPGLNPAIRCWEIDPARFDGQVIDHVCSLADRHVTSLDEFLEAVYVVFQRCVERGAIGIKDQQAYSRVISFDLVPKGDAERLFNAVLSDPRQSLGWPESKPLGDFLFHQYMRFARDLDLPVQLHTGHMARIRNRVDKTNAAHLVSVLELHRDVRFDLFHGSWPYLGDLLFLGKNYPNVALDFCWLHIIDPDYAAELMERAVLTMPHSKIHGFGGDYFNVPEFAVAHLEIARENMAGTLARLVERGWLDEDQALSLAADWLFNNPNRFFKLGLEEI